VLAGGWYAANAPYLQHRTLLVRQQTWPLQPPVEDPRGIAYLAGNVYVTSYRNNTVGELNVQTGTYRLIAPIGASGPLTFTHPGDIKAGPEGLLYVLNNGDNDHALFVMRPDGVVVRQVPLGVKSSTGMGLDLGRERDLYVTDMGRVLKYEEGGGPPLAVWGGLTGGFNNVMGILVGSDGMVYAAENSGLRVQQLDSRGQFIRSYDLGCSPSYLAADGDWIDASCNRGLVSINTRTGVVQRSMAAPVNDLPSTPAGIAYGPDGTLYILDYGILVACKVQH
jgi:DNA-binding beta-propeller fold protein YncE